MNYFASQNTLNNINTNSSNSSVFSSVFKKLGKKPVEETQNYLPYAQIVQHLRWSFFVFVLFVVFFIFIESFYMKKIKINQIFLYHFMFHRASFDINFVFVWLDKITIVYDFLIIWVPGPELLMYAFFWDIQTTQFLYEYMLIWKLNKNKA